MSDPGTLGRRYAPVALLVAVQVALVFIAPSTPPSQSAGGFDAGLGQSTSQSAASGGPAAGSAEAAGAGGSGSVGAPSAAGGGAATASGAGGGQRGGATGGGPVGYHSTDRSHCDRNGKQIGPTFYMPPCVPVWHGGNNGGATMTGVSATQVRYVYYRSAGNAQVNSILNAEGLAASAEQTCEALQAFDKEINKRWEFYGRKVVSVDGRGQHAGSKQQSGCHFPYYQGTCPLTPPEPQCDSAEADDIASLKPAFVILAGAAEPGMAYRLAHDHILTISLFLAPEQYFDQLAPYLYSLSMNGTQAARLFSEYWCKKLSGKPVKFAGPEVLHPNGNLTAPPPRRKLAIFFPENNGDPTYRLSGELVKQLVTGGECGKPGDAMTFSYTSDINTAQQQTQTAVAEMKKNHITSVTCFCDPIAPVFSSNGMDQQNFHPELVGTGTGLLDYDPLAQLYDQNVWRYAFGLSDLGNSTPFPQSDAVKAWQDSGQSGMPDKTENLSWSLYSLMAAMIQVAGPNLTPQTVHQGLVSLPPMGGDPTHPMIGFRGAYQWTALQDVREAWWCPTTTSPINGQPGSYVPVDGGKRYQLGQMDGELKAFPNGPCAG